jgi:twitching motility protein PilT
MGYELADVSRFRVSVFRQRGAMGAVMRLIPLKIPHYSEIGLPESLITKMTQIPNGLILVTGPTGSGKSTTVASFLEFLNTDGDLPKHIVTIEDPIEYDLKSKVCVIDQREIGIDTKGYVPGLRSALRQMPHIIFVGEMRDRETIEIALTAAETGNIVVSTLSTQSAAKTINRIIDVFPLGDQAEIRTRLALSLRAVISQVLLRRKDIPGRIAAREILLVNNSAANLIREGKIHQINNVITSSFNEGMILLDDSLLELHRVGTVHTADVMSRLQDPEKARLLMVR